MIEWRKTSFLTYLTTAGADAGVKILEKDGPGIKNNDFGFATLVSILLN